MSEQTMNPKIEDEIVELFDGETIEVALKFVDYLNANGLTPKLWRPEAWKIPYNDCYLCMIQFEQDKWVFTFFSGDYSGEFDEGLIQTVQEHVQICTRCDDGCMFGKDAEIFGKEYLNACSQLTIQFENPNGDTFECIKALVEHSKKIVTDSVSWHAHN